MSLYKYKSIFGNPNEGLHKYRMFNVAIFDVISTIIVGIGNFIHIGNFCT
jgi:hypothetical protein